MEAEAHGCAAKSPFAVARERLGLAAPGPAAGDRGLQGGSWPPRAACSHEAPEGCSDVSADPRPSNASIRLPHGQAALDQPAAASDTPVFSLPPLLPPLGGERRFTGALKATHPSSQLPTPIPLPHAG